MPPAPQSEVVTSSNAATFITSTNTTLDSIELPGEKKLKAGGGEGPNTPKAGIEPKIIGSNPIYSVIQTGNPISALFEYCKKGTLRYYAITLLYAMSVNQQSKAIPRK
jgi:hypothetical protein